jgi:hypothetical protein
MFLETKCKSYTGQIIYSDCYREERGTLASEGVVQQIPYLNQLAGVPFIGCLAGLTRMVISIIHCLGHLILAAIYRDKGHLYHAAKGAAEALRGLIEAIPLVGRIFVWAHDPSGMRKAFMLCGGHAPSPVQRSFFLIQITDPSSRDLIDRAEGIV